MRPRISGTAPSNGTIASSTVRLYRNSTCTQEVGSGSVTSGRTFNIQASSDLATGSVEQTITLYGRAFTSGGLGSPGCTTLTTYRIDTRAPTLTITAPAVNATVSSASATYTGACEAGLSIALSGDRQSPSTATCAAGGTFSVVVTLTSGYGSKSVAFAQTDAAGNSTSVSRIISYPDPGPPPDPGAQLSSASVFFSGHSLLDGVSGQLYPIALAGGVTLGFRNQMIGGSVIRIRADETSQLQALRSGNYDTLLLAENHHILRNIQWERTIEFVRLYQDLLIEGNSRARGFFWHTWLDAVDDYNSAEMWAAPNEWIAYEKADVIAWDCVVDRVNSSLERLGRADRVRSIPANGALVALVERALADPPIPGLDGVVDPNTGVRAPRLQSLFSDRVHIREPGWYYLSLFAYAYIYNRSPVGISYRPSSMSASAATIYQQVAWNYYQQYQTARVTRTAAQCNQHMVNTFCELFSGITGDDAAGCQRYYNSGNSPFDYNASSDASRWLPKP